MTQWIVVRTQPRRDRWAAENVERQGCGYYLPVYESQTGSGKLRRSRAVPLFPSYLFVKIFEQWRFLQGTFGISHVIMGSGGQPAGVLERHIDAMLRHEDKEGYVRLPKRQRFAVNEKVRVTAGPFVSQVGLWQGQTPAQREKVLIEILGGKISVLIDSNSLEAA